MGEEIIQTDVDKLIDILKSEKKMELGLLAKKINVPEETVQQWVDFLVEEKIVSIEYDFTKPIVNMLEKPKEKKEYFKEDFLKYKESFQKKSAKKKGTPEYIWKQHILENLELMKQFFFSEAEKRNLGNKKELWEEYKKKVSML